MPPARTGRDNTNSSPVIIIDHVNRVILSKLTSTPRLFHIVDIKLRLLRILEAPAIWREKITKSTLLPLCPKEDLNGG